MLLHNLEQFNFYNLAIQILKNSWCTADGKRRFTFRPSV